MKFPQLMLVLALLVLSALNLAAQTKKLPVKEFDRQMDAAFEATEKKVRRITKSYTEFASGKAVSGIFTYEYIPPDRFRSYGRSSRTQEKFDYIEANDRCYIKKEDGIWQPFFKGPDIPPYLFWVLTKAGSGTKIKTSDLRKEVLNGQIVKKYSRESRQSFESKIAPSPPVEGLQEVWIGSEGLILRAESIYYDGNSGAVLLKWILVWEYDPKNIKIEAPMK